jgi:hypothetical protein
MMDDERMNQGAAESIDEAVSSFLSALVAKEIKLAVADVLRLLDLRKQLLCDELGEVTVRWVASNLDPLAINP